MPIEPSKLYKIAPIIAIPEIAFDPDINGVCNVGGTLVIIQNQQTANINCYYSYIHIYPLFKNCSTILCKRTII